MLYMWCRARVKFIKECRRITNPAERELDTSKNPDSDAVSKFQLQRIRDIYNKILLESGDTNVPMYIKEGQLSKDKK
jgi:hypothetical protein